METQKIVNEHADEQMQVEGTEIQSEDNPSEANDFNERQMRQNNRDALDANGGVAAPKPLNVQGAYKPSDYSNLGVSGQVKQLFKMIGRYSPISIELDTKLKAFVPEYIPTVGEADAFLKMPRPDGQPQTLGLNQLDEPCLNQTDRAKLSMMLPTFDKQYRGVKSNKIHAIDEAEKNPKQIVAWIESVAEIHKNKQPPSVSYSKTMPDINSLMQVWPQEVEQLLDEIKIPNEDIDLTLEEYSKLACNILDIPIHDSNPQRNIIESLHVMFSLYSAFKENEHFQKNEGEA